MFKIIISFFLLGSNLLHSKNKFSWDYIRENGASKLYDKPQIVYGEMSEVRKHIRARDTFYTFFVNDPNSDEKIQVKLYTIIKLKRVNLFKCKDSQWIKIKEKLYKSKKYLARMTVKEKASILECKESDSKD